MSETVSDILGKGFKFETRTIVEELPPRSVFGSVPAFIGGAHWGPVDVPSLVNKDFNKYFGQPVFAEDENDNRTLDFSGLAAKDHLKNSQYCYYTRITDGTDKKATMLLRKTAKPAFLVGEGAIQNTTVVIYPSGTLQNNKFSITKDAVTKVIELEGSTSAFKALNLYEINWSTYAGRKIIFSIDGKFLEYVISKTTFADIYTDIISAFMIKFSVSEVYAQSLIEKIDFTNVLETEETFEDGDIVKIGDVFKTFDTDAFTDETPVVVASIVERDALEGTAVVGDLVYVSGENKIYEFTGESDEFWEEKILKNIEGIIFKSDTFGSTSNIFIYDFPGTTYNSNNIFSTSGSNSSINQIVESINAQIKEDTNGIDDILVGFDAFKRLYVRTTNTGLSESFSIDEIENSVYSVLQISENDIDIEKFGEDEKVGGKAVAVYSGEEGNKIGFFKRKDANGNVLQVFMGSSILGTFFDYSYEVDSDVFIGTMINTDRVVSKYVTLEIDPGVEVIPEFEENETLYLSGGTSGLNNLQDFMYINAVNEYKNLDLYDIDIVSCSGVISENVVDAIIDVCNYRQDCFLVTDTPQQMTPYLVEKWHNGESDTRTKALDSEYALLYYPWILINTDSVKMPKQWVAPSVKVVSAITNCDIINQNKYSIPAGHKNALIRDIEAVERYLTEEEKQTLYSDRLNNNINPIVYNKNYGYFIDGQKTSKKGRNPLNRIKALRTALFIKRSVFTIAPDYFWLPIDSRTRAALEYDLTLIMDQLVKDRCIKADYVVDVSPELNDEYIEADGGLVGRIEWYPVKAVEKIKIINVIRDKQVSFSIEI